MSVVPSEGRAGRDNTDVVEVGGSQTEEDTEALDRHANFWDSEFEKDKRSAKVTEWMCGANELWPHLERIIDAVPGLRPTARVLNVGCGNCSLGQVLVNNGFLDVNNLDFSEVVIGEMQRAHPAQKWCVGDVTNMAGFADNAFNIIVDKGTSDTLQFRRQNKDSKALVGAMFKEVHRCLAPGGNLCDSDRAAMQHTLTFLDQGFM